jgi:hypothetical protein
MVHFTISRFTGAGWPTVVVAVRPKPQGESRPTLRLIKGGAG